MTASVPLASAYLGGRPVRRSAGSLTTSAPMAAARATMAAPCSHRRADGVTRTRLGVHSLNGWGFGACAVSGWVRDADMVDRMWSSRPWFASKR